MNPFKSLPHQSTLSQVYTWIGAMYRVQNCFYLIIDYIQRKGYTNGCH